MASASSSIRRILSHRNQRPPSLRRHPPPLTNPTPPSWRRPLPRLLASFILGLLLGVSPFPSPPEADVPHHTFFPPDPTPRGGARVMGTVKSVQLHAVARPFLSGEPARSLLIVVTPTYNRALQAYHLTRLGQTLWLVRPPLLWIVVEVGAPSPETADVLRRTGVMYRHLVSSRDSGDIKDRGVRQRNTALEHIERHNLNGVVYFADDDNVYSVELFEEMRGTRRFGTWPVAMLAQSKSKAILEGPVCSGSKIVGWHTNEKSKRLRRFHVDMSGFAFNSTILWDHKHWRHSSSKAIRQLDTVKEGFQETTFIEQLVEDESQMESVPYNCSKIMNWHLHLDARNLAYPKGWKLSRNLEGVVPLHYM